MLERNSEEVEGESQGVEEQH